MPAAEISKQLRLILENSSEARSVPHLLQLVDEFVSSSDADALVQLEDELQQICKDVIDHSIYHSQIKVFLAVLYHLLPILPASSTISTWFDLVLPPALREPKLPQEAVNYAKDIILAALTSISPAEDETQGDAEQEKGQVKVRDFRRRLMDLYLLDAYNESSGDDVLEWAVQGDGQKETSACWKANLEDIHIKLGMLRPRVGCFLRSDIAYLLNWSLPYILGSAYGNIPLLHHNPAPTSAVDSAERVYLTAGVPFPWSGLRETSARSKPSVRSNSGQLLHRVYSRYHYSYEAAPRLCC